MKVLTGVALAGLLVSPAAAEEFYVVQERVSQACRIAQTPPSTAALRLVDGGKVYFHRSQAERALQSLSKCQAVETGASKRQTAETHSDGQKRIRMR